MRENPRIVVTGANGFLGTNLIAALYRTGGWTVDGVVRATSDEAARSVIATASCIVHAAGVTRPPNRIDFETGNVEITRRLIDLLRNTGPRPILFASSIRSGDATDYGRSKAAAENLLVEHGRATGAPTAIFRLGQMFGPGARPNYNSIVATLLHRAAEGRPLQVNTPDAPLPIVFIDDVVEALLRRIKAGWSGICFPSVEPTYACTVGQIAAVAAALAADRRVPDELSPNLISKLRFTYLAYRSALGCSEAAEDEACNP